MRIRAIWSLAPVEAFLLLAVSTNVVSIVHMLLTGR